MKYHPGYWRAVYWMITGSILEDGGVLVLLVVPMSPGAHFCDL